MPLAEGVSTLPGHPLVNATRSASINALMTKADPVSRWHHVQ